MQGTYAQAHVNVAGMCAAHAYVRRRVISAREVTVSHAYVLVRQMKILASEQAVGFALRAQAGPAAKTVSVDAIGSAAAPPPPAAAGSPARAAASGDAPAGNNYHRPSGQNVGNFLTARNSSRVSAPPGGASQITFG